MSIFKKEPQETFMEAIHATLLAKTLSPYVRNLSRDVGQDELLSPSSYAFQGNNLWLTLPSALYDRRTNSVFSCNIPIPSHAARRLVAAGRREGLSLPSALEYAGTRGGNVLAGAVKCLSATAAFGLSALVLGSNLGQHFSDWLDQGVSDISTCITVATTDTSVTCASDKSQTAFPKVVMRHADGRIDYTYLDKTYLTVGALRPTTNAERLASPTYVKSYQDMGEARKLNSEQVLYNPSALVALSQYVSVNGCPEMTPEKLKTQFEKLSSYAEALTSDKASDAILRAVVNNPGKVCAL